MLAAGYLIFAATLIIFHRAGWRPSGRREITPEGL